jgi:hypothetical protein
MKARSESPAEPWVKQGEAVPFRTKPGTYHSAKASPGQVIKADGHFRLFFSASTHNPITRTLSIATTTNLNGPWAISPAPLVPLEEQVENSSLYHDEESAVWFLFTNHVGVKSG